MNIPESIQKILSSLKEEKSISEIWLIGSQATGNATSKSDWDILVFSSRDPSVVARRAENIDVLWAGPSGRVLLEGQPASLTFQFSDFQWLETEPGKAQYRGRRFADVPDGVARNASEPIQSFTDGAAVRLWLRTKP